MFDILITLALAIFCFFLGVSARRDLEKIEDAERNDSKRKGKANRR